MKEPHVKWQMTPTSETRVRLKGEFWTKTKLERFKAEAGDDDGVAVITSRGQTLRASIKKLDWDELEDE